MVSVLFSDQVLHTRTYFSVRSHRQGIPSVEGGMRKTKERADLPATRRYLNGLVQATAAGKDNQVGVIRRRSLVWGSLNVRRPSTRS